MSDDFDERLAAARGQPIDLRVLLGDKRANDQAPTCRGTAVRR